MQSQTIHARAMCHTIVDSVMPNTPRKSTINKFMNDSKYIKLNVRTTQSHYFLHCAPTLIMKNIFSRRNIHFGFF